MIEDAEIEFRLILLRQSIERIEMNYLRAFDLGAADPVVLDLDPLGDQGRSIAEEVGPPGPIAAMIAEAPLRDILPVILWGAPPRVAVDLVESRFPGSGEAIRRVYPEEGYLAIVIARENFPAVEMPPVPV